MKWDDDSFSRFVSTSGGVRKMSELTCLSDRHLKRLGHQIHQNILFYYHYHVFGKKKSISAAQRFYKY